MSWVSQTFIAIGLLVPAWIGATFFKKNYQIPSGVYSGWYFLGTGITIILADGTSGRVLTAQPHIIAIIFGIGLTAGGIANASLFSAVENAPNPGMPIALCNANGMLVFLVSLALANLAPQYFPEVEGGMRDLVGIILLMSGAAVIAIR